MLPVLIRHARRHEIERLHAAALLVIIGFKPKQVYSQKQFHRPNDTSKGRHFLNRSNEYELRDLLIEAKRLYRKTMKNVHPDVGGSLEDASRVTRAWRRILQLFALRGVTL